jgi:hypothetical protein
MADEPNMTESGYQNAPSNWWTSNLQWNEIPELRWPRSIEIYDKMRRTDDQVLSVLRAVTLPIRRTAWRVDGTGCKASVTQLIADDLGLPIVGKSSKKRVRNGGRFNFDEHLRLALLKLPFGHSFFEQVYTYDEASELYHLAKLAWRPPRTIEFVNVASDGGLISIQQHGTVGGLSEPIPVRNLVAHVNDQEGGNWLGQSLLRSAYKFWLLKESGLRVQAQTNERNGMGVNIYKSKPISDNPTDEELKREREERREGLKAARALRAGTTTGVAIIGGSELSTQGVDGKLPDPEKALTRYDDGIARSVLAHFLTLGGDGATGSYALGDTLAEFFTASLQAVANEIADVVNQHVVEDLVDANWGPEEPAPRIVFDEIGSKASIDAPGLQSLLQAGGLRMDDPTEEWIRNRFGMPPRDPKTERETPATAPPTETDPTDPPDPEEDPSKEQK